MYLSLLQLEVELLRNVTFYKVLLQDPVQPVSTLYPNPSCPTAHPDSLNPWMEPCTEIDVGLFYASQPLLCSFLL